MRVSYRLVKHAGHYGNATQKNGGGHDLDEWDVTAEKRPRAVDADAPEFLLFRGVEWHHGYVDSDGNQHWVFFRRAPMSPEHCERCPS